MATHSSILSWRIPWTEEPVRLQSMGSQGSDTTERLSTHTHSALTNLHDILSHKESSRGSWSYVLTIREIELQVQKTNLWLPAGNRVKGCKKVKVLAVQLCLTLCNPVDYSPPGSSVHNSQTRYWSGLPFSSPEDFPNPGIEHGLPRYRQILYNLSHEGSP